MSPFRPRTKKAAIDELVDALTQAGYVTEHEKLKEAVWARETTRTTGIGHGVGIPHGKSACIQSLRMAIGLPAQPIEFQAIDGKPVDLVFLLASPQDQTGPHIQALAKISRLLTDEDFRSRLKTAPSAEALWQMVLDAEEAAAVAQANR